MTIDERILGIIRDLPPHKKSKVLAFVELLKRDGDPAEPLDSLEGLWSDLDIDIADEDIAQLRQEMWSSFGRDVER